MLKISTIFNQALARTLQGGPINQKNVIWILEIHNELTEISIWEWKNYPLPIKSFLMGKALTHWLRVSWVGSKIEANKIKRVWARRGLVRPVRMRMITSTRFARFVRLKEKRSRKISKSRSWTNCWTVRKRIDSFAIKIRYKIFHLTQGIIGERKVWTLICSLNLHQDRC